MSRTILSFAAAVLLAACNPIDNGYHADKTPKMTKSSPATDKLFAQTKPICFGRFIIEVPATAQVVWGPTHVNWEIVSYPGQSHRISSEIRSKAEEFKGLKHRELPSAFVGVFDGPNAESKVVVGYPSIDDAYETRLFSFVRLSPHAFVQNAAALMTDNALLQPPDPKRYRKTLDEMQDIASRLRLRQDIEVPAEPGICLEAGFVPEADGRYHEMTSIGFRFPEYPDVSFSITTTKTQRINPDDSLEAALKRGKMASEGSGLGGWFSRIKTLREGERRMGDWEGAEKLARVPPQETGKPSSHEFAFRSVGVPKDMFRPYADVAMSTGVEQNTKGGLEPSLKDDEAVALWDRLTGSIRTRP